MRLVNRACSCSSLLSNASIQRAWQVKLSRLQECSRQNLKQKYDLLEVVHALLVILENRSEFSQVKATNQVLQVLLTTLYTRAHHLVLNKVKSIQSGSII